VAQVDPDYRLVVGPAGLQRWVHKDQAGELIGPWRLASQKAERAARVDLESNVFEEGMAVADVAMLGIPSSLAIAAHEAIGNEEHAESVRQVAQRGREAIGPTGEMLGLGLGLVGSLPLKGTGILAKTLKGIGAPMRGISRAGQLVERGVRMGARRGGLRGATLRRTLPEVARGGVEGLAYGGIQGITDSVIYDKELTAEQLAVHAGLGAGIGAGATVGLKMLGALARPGKKAYGRVVQKFTGNEKAEGGLASRAYGGLSGVVSSAKSGDITKFSKAGKESAALRRRVIHDADELADANALEALGGFRRIGKNYNTVADAVLRGKGKEKNYAKIISQENRPTQFAILREEVKKSQDKMRLMAHRDNKSHYNINAEFKKLVSRGDDYLANIDDIERAGRNSASAFIIADGYKAEIGKIAKANARMSRKGPTRVNTAREMGDLYESMRSTLQRRDIWGKVADAQDEINSLWTKHIPDQIKFNRALSESVTPVGFGPDDFIPTSDKVAAYYKRIIDPARDDTSQTVRRYLKSVDDWGVAVEKHVDLTPKQKAALQEMRKGVKDSLKNLGKHEKFQAERNAFSAMEEAQTRGLGAMMLGATGLGAYGLVEGEPGLVGAGLLAAALMRPGMAVRQIAAIEKAAGDIGVKSGGKLASFFKRAKPDAKRAVRIGAIEAERRNRTEFEERRRVLRSKSPEQASNDVKRELSVVSSVSPETMALAGDVAQMAHAYALENLPSDTSPYLLSPSVPPSKGEIADYMKRMRILDDPTKLLDDLLDGKIRGGDVEVVRDNFPAIYQQMREDALGKVADMAMQGKQLPYKDRVQLDMLLDLRIEPTLDPELFQTLQGLYAAPPTPPQQPPQQTSNAPDLASAWRTDVQQLEAADKEGYQ
jgi:hypothetical protein